MLNHLSTKTIEEICNLAAANMSAESELNTSDGLTIPSQEADAFIERLLNDDREEYVLLVERIQQLSENELAELMALMWFGRGDISHNPKDFQKFLEKAKRDVALDSTPYYIAGKSPLEKYLRDGLKYIGL